MPYNIGYNLPNSDNTLLRGNRVSSLRTHAPWLDIPRVFGLVMRSKNLTKCSFQLQHRDWCEGLSCCKYCGAQYGWLIFLFQKLIMVVELEGSLCKRVGLRLMD